MNYDIKKQQFQEYIKDYDINNHMIDLKIQHTYRVVDFSYEIAKSLNLDEQEINTAMIIALFHDIGRFDQIKLYNTFDDSKSFDHASYGVDTIKKHFNIFDEPICDAIFYHNKFKINNNLSDQSKIYSKIIRDADKLDIINLFLYNKKYNNVKKDILHDNIYQKAINNLQIKHEDVISKLDKAILVLCLIHDFNFKYSYNKIIKENIITKFIDNLIENNITEEEKLNNIKESILNYTKNKIKEDLC